MPTFQSLNGHEEQPTMHVTPPSKPCAPPPIILSANLEQMKYLEEMRRASRELKDLIKKPPSN